MVREVTKLATPSVQKFGELGDQSRAKLGQGVGYLRLVTGIHASPAKFAIIKYEKFRSKIRS